MNEKHTWFDVGRTSSPNRVSKIDEYIVLRTRLIKSPLPERLTNDLVTSSVIPSFRTERECSCHIYSRQKLFLSMYTLIIYWQCVYLHSVTARFGDQNELKQPNGKKLKLKVNQVTSVTSWIIVTQHCYRTFYYVD